MKQDLYRELSALRTGEWEEKLRLRVAVILQDADRDCKHPATKALVCGFSIHDALSDRFWTESEVQPQREVEIKDLRARPGVSTDDTEAMADLFNRIYPATRPWEPKPTPLEIEAATAALRVYLRAHKIDVLSGEQMILDWNGNGGICVSHYELRKITQRDEA